VLDDRTVNESASPFREARPAIIDNNTVIVNMSVRAGCRASSVRRYRHSDVILNIPDYNASR